MIFDCQKAKSMSGHDFEKSRISVRTTAVDQGRQRMASGIRKIDSTCSYVEPGMVEFARKTDREDHQLAIYSKLGTPGQLKMRGGGPTEEFY